MKNKVIKVRITKTVRKHVKKLSRSCTYTVVYNLILNAFAVVILNYILEITQLWPKNFLPGVKGQDLGGSETVLRSYNKEYIRYSNTMEMNGMSHSCNCNRVVKI